MNPNYNYGIEKARTAVQYMATWDVPLRERLQRATQELSNAREVNFPPDAWPKAKAIISEATALDSMKKGEREDLAERLFQLYVQLVERS